MFSGEEKSGYLVFPILHEAVREASLHLDDVALRFDYRDEPVEAVDLEFRFHREVERLYPKQEENPPKAVEARGGAPP